MRLHSEGDSPVDAAANVRKVLELLAVAIVEGNPRADLLAGGGRDGLGIILMAAENTVKYVGRRCEELANSRPELRS